TPRRSSFMSGGMYGLCDEPPVTVPSEVRAGNLPRFGFALGLGGCGRLVGASPPARQPIGASARRHQEVLADAPAQFVHAVKELRQVGVQAGRQDLVDACVLEFGLELAGAAQ